MFEMIGFHVAELFLIYRYMHCFFDREQTPILRNLAVYAVYLAVVCLMDTLPYQYIADIILMDLLAQLYHGKQGKKLFAAFLIQGMNLLCEILAVCLLYDGKVDGVYDTAMYYAIYLFMYLCERIMENFCIRNIKEDTTLRHWDLLIFLPVISVMIAYVLITFDMTDREIGVVVSAGLLCLNLIVFYICDELVGAYIKLKERAMVEQQLESYSNQLNVVMKSEECVRGLRHDLKNHLSELLLMAEGNRTQEITAYVRNMQQELTNEKEHISSGNAAVDSLMNLKLEQAKEALAHVRCRISVPQELQIQAFDWNIILGNLMDNAIRAAAESEEKLLDIHISYQRGMLLIQMKNSYSGALIRSGDCYLSTKEKNGAEGQQVHGLGMKNVKRIVQKYNGSIEVHDEGHLFDVRILMYVPMETVC
ncbi:MAG: GHKL domain-containing protein [Lachnospiraceae bacterium]|nr:GHKL domain-containing protein [Lachnospiraceae bacterium]